MQQLSDIEQQSSINFDNLLKDSGMDSSSESVSSDNSQRQQALEMRHQELLKKQKQLQEQYQRLQQISKNSIPLVTSTANEEKKNTHTNFVPKTRTNMSNIIADKNCSSVADTTSTANGFVNMSKTDDLDMETGSNNNLSKTINKVYETDIL